MKLVNLTSEELTFLLPSGATLTLPPRVLGGSLGVSDETPARVGAVLDIPVVTERSSIRGLPEPEEGTTYVVQWYVLNALPPWPPRPDVLAIGQWVMTDSTGERASGGFFVDLVARNWALTTLGAEEGALHDALKEVYSQAGRLQDVLSTTHLDECRFERATTPVGVTDWILSSKGNWAERLADGSKSGLPEGEWVLWVEKTGPEEFAWRGRWGAERKGGSLSTLDVAMKVADGWLRRVSQS